ncbi:ArdC-like ssDNA-binding domain-containing protein [Micromonospora chokoriensis]
MPRTTPRKSAARKTSSRRQYSEAERAAYRERDKAISARSTEILERTDAVRMFAEYAATGGVSTRILNYSLRNQMLLHEQAAEQGFALTDVATSKEWRARGRHPLVGTTGLRLIKPRGNGKKDSANADERDAGQEPDDASNVDDGSAADGDGTAKAPLKPKFCTIAVFDIAQTGVIPLEERSACPTCPAQKGEPCHAECRCPICVPSAPTPDPVAALWAKLSEQLTEYGYALEAPAATPDGHRVRVDHDARTITAAPEITAGNPAAVADLAAALAEIIARTDRERDIRRQERRVTQAEPAPTA